MNRRTFLKSSTAVAVAQSLPWRAFAAEGWRTFETVTRIEKFMAAMPLGFAVLRDRGGAVGKAWKAKLLPASYLIGRDGRIRYVAYGELDWSSDVVRARVNELLQ